jgi:hypothetical protein
VKPNSTVKPSSTLAQKKPGQQSTSAAYHPGTVPGATPQSGATPKSKSAKIAACAPADVVLSLFTSQPSYARSARPKFSVYAVSTATAACTLSYGPASVHVVVTSRGHVVWDSAACALAGDPKVRFTLGVPQGFSVTWDHAAKKPAGCGGSLAPGTLGTLEAVAFGPAGESSPVRTFKVVKLAPQRGVSRGTRLSARPARLPLRRPPSLRCCPSRRRLLSRRGRSPGGNPDAAVRWRRVDPAHCQHWPLPFPRAPPSMPRPWPPVRARPRFSEIRYLISYLLRSVAPVAPVAPDAPVVRGDAAGRGAAGARASALADGPSPFMRGATTAGPVGVCRSPPWTSPTLSRRGTNQRWAGVGLAVGEAAGSWL